MTESAWRKYSKTDPFYEVIAPSLLNSDDIYRYASLGCLVNDFDESRLLPAGYRMRFLGDLIHWVPKKNGKLRRINKNIADGEEFTLPHNSITYLHMEEEFRMPQYVAARFNLRITHVHQGLLLGTGPLIDPGFEGRIMIPLHNLTDNEYSMVGGETLIHVEFTKLNELPRWRENAKPEDFDDHYKPFSDEKIEMTPNDYFNKSQVRARGGVVSNLESALAEAERLNASTKRTLLAYQGFGIIAALALIYGGYNLVQSTNKVLQGVQEVATEAKRTVANATEESEADSPVDAPPVATSVTPQMSSESADEVELRTESEQEEVPELETQNESDVISEVGEPQN